MIMQPKPASWPWLSLLMAFWPVTVLADKSAADYYVRDLPGLPKNVPFVKMHAGHIEITPEHNGNIFFWHFQNKHIANKQRTVLWLNGGPGCSSEDGALMEIGPYRLTDDHNLTLNNGSWNEFANLLFVDNPVGTGYSYVDTDSFVVGLNRMADQMIVFLDKFFSLFPEYARDDVKLPPLPSSWPPLLKTPSNRQQLYLAGESYAGQYIPYIAQAIVARNKKLSDKDTDKEPWNLRGLLIGNGWVSPSDQYEAYLTFAVAKGIVPKDSDLHTHLLGDMEVCRQAQAASPDRTDYDECEKVLSDILERTKKGNMCYNMYDVRLKDTFPSCGMNWPPDLSAVTPYLRRTDVIAALHVNTQRNTGWTECSGAVGSAFKSKSEGTKPSISLLPDLAKDMQILLFSGAEDLICNHLGTEALISNLEWNGGKGFEVSPGNWAPRRKWTFEGTDAGFWQEARNLTYVLFYNASHMVPFDYPRRTRDMLDRFMKVDISSIGGEPTDSRIDGEKGPETTVGGASNQTQAHQEETQKKLDEAKWDAYERSGEIVLIILVIVVLIWGYFIWRQRRASAEYRALNGHEPFSGSGSRLEAFRRKTIGTDLEAASFNEAELDDLHVETPVAGRGYSTGDNESEEEETGRGKRQPRVRSNGSGSR